MKILYEILILITAILEFIYAAVNQAELLPFAYHSNSIEKLSELKK